MDTLASPRVIATNIDVLVCGVTVYGDLVFDQPNAQLSIVSTTGISIPLCISAFEIDQIGRIERDPEHVFLKADGDFSEVMESFTNAQLFHDGIIEIWTSHLQIDGHDVFELAIGERFTFTAKQLNKIKTTLRSAADASRTERGRIEIMDAFEIISNIQHFARVFNLN